MSPVIAQTPTPTQAVLADIDEVLGQLAEDKSRDWSDEIEKVANAREQLETAHGLLTSYRDLAGPVDELEENARYTRLGKFAVPLLGANSDWAGADTLDAIVHAWNDGENHPHISPDNLAYWREVADELGIAHDDEVDTFDDAAPLEDPEHVPTYEQDPKYRHLFTVFCSCGKSSYGASLRDSAEASFRRHLANPGSDEYRSVEATQRLLGMISPITERGA